MILKYLFPVLIAFMLFSCHQKGKVERVQTEQVLQSGYLLLHLRGKVTPMQVEGAYQRYHMQSVQSVRKGENSWVFRFDTSLISTPDIVHLLDDSQFVSNAETIIKE